MRDPLEPCMCSHLKASHDASGCLICAAQGKPCPSYWTKQEYDQAVQAGLVAIAKDMGEQRETQRKARYDPQGRNPQSHK